MAISPECCRVQETGCSSLPPPRSAREVAVAVTQESTMGAKRLTPKSPRTISSANMAPASGAWKEAAMPAPAPEASSTAASRRGKARKRESDAATRSDHQACRERLPHRDPPPERAPAHVDGLHHLDDAVTAALRAHVPDQEAGRERAERGTQDAHPDRRLDGDLVQAAAGLVESAVEDPEQDQRVVEPEPQRPRERDRAHPVDLEAGEPARLALCERLGAEGEGQREQRQGGELGVPARRLELRAKAGGPGPTPGAEEGGGHLASPEEHDLDEADALREQAGRNPRVDADHRGDAEEQRPLPRDARQGEPERLAPATEEPPDPAGGWLLRLLRAELHFPAL